MGLFQRRTATKIGGGTTTDYFSKEDAGFTAEGVPSFAKGGVWAITSIVQRVTEKKGAIRVIKMRCIVLPKCADGSHPRSLSVGCERTMYAEAAKPYQWDDVGACFLYAAGVPLAPERRIEAIEHVRKLTGKYPPGYTPGALDIQNPEHKDAIDAAYELAVNLLEPFASEGEGVNLACAGHNDGRGLIVVNSFYEGATFKDKDTGKRAPKIDPTTGKQPFFTNHRGAALTESQFNAVVEAVAGGTLNADALSALGEPFVKAAKAAYAAAQEGA